MHPDSIGKPERALKVTFCWTEVSGYITTCWQALAERHPVKLHVIHLKGLTPEDCIVPDQYSLASSIPNNILDLAQAHSPRAIAQLVADTSPDVVVTCGWLYRPYVEAVLDPKLRDVILTVGMDSPWEGRWRQRLARFHLSQFVARIDIVMVAGERSREYALRLGVPDERVFSGFYGFDFKRFEQAAAIRMAGSWPRRFLFAGRYVKEKDLETLLAAYRLYRQSTPSPWGLSCCGIGPLGPLLAGAEGVTNHGFVPPKDLPALFAQHGAFVMPSRFEPWGVAIGEAAASGMPLICSTACGAALDLLRPFYNGLSFPPGDVSQLARAMAWIAAHHDELPLLGRRSQCLAGAYSAEVWTDRWYDCFSNALANRRG